MKKEPSPELDSVLFPPHPLVHEQRKSTLSESESAVTVLHEDRCRSPGQFTSIQTSPSASIPKSQTLNQHSGLQYKSAEDSFAANSVISPADISSFTGLSSAMTPGYPRYIEPTSAPLALDNFSVHRTVTEDPDLDMPFSSDDFPIMTTSAGLVNGINSENLYGEDMGEDMFSSTYTQLSPGCTGADAYTADWEGFHPDMFGTGNAQLPHNFTPYALRFLSPSLFNGTGEVKELEASSNHGNEGTSQPYARRMHDPSTSAAQYSCIQRHGRSSFQ